MVSLAQAVCCSLLPILDPSSFGSFAVFATSSFSLPSRWCLLTLPPSMALPSWLFCVVVFVCLFVFVVLFVLYCFLFFVFVVADQRLKGMVTVVTCFGGCCGSGCFS